MGVRNCESCAEWAWAFGTARLVELFQEEVGNLWAGCYLPEATWQGVLGRVRGELTGDFVRGSGRRMGDAEADLRDSIIGVGFVS